MTLKEYFNNFDQIAQETAEWFAGEISTLRTTRVTTSLVENIRADHYGARTPISGLASISNSDARTLLIAPWDETAIPAIEKALTEAQLGVNPVVDGKVIRLGFPMLTEEMRKQTIKQLNQKAEEARVRLRKARDESLSKIKKEQKNGDLTEDDMYEGKRELDNLIEKSNKLIEDTVSKKEADIAQI